MKNLYESLIGSSFILGTVIGSGFAGSMIRFGRRRVLIVGNIICALAVVPTLFLNIYTICVGRFIFGFVAGIYQVNVPRMIEETVPMYLLGMFGPFTNLANCGGKMITLGLGAFAPDDKDHKALAESNFWRYTFAVPWIL